jgi:hypothetical protein
MMRPELVPKYGRWVDMEGEMKEVYHGGNTNMRSLMRFLTKDEIARGCRLEMMDVVSLYPSSMFNHRYPTGCLFPTDYDLPGMRQPSYEDLCGIEGMIKCRMWWPSDKPPPFHPRDRYVVNGRLLHSLEEDEETAVPRTRTLIKFRAAVEQGYRWDGVVYVLHALNPVDNLFNAYITDFYRIKMKYGGVPDWYKESHTEEKIREWCRECEETCGVGLFEELEKEIAEYPDKSFEQAFAGWFEKNSGKKGGAKLMLNSLYGKFGERRNKETTKFLEDRTELQQFVETDLGYTGFYQLGNGYVAKTLTRDRDYAMNVNRLIAAYVTDYAMLYLNQEMEKYGADCLYHDTDSTIVFWDPAVRGAARPTFSDHLGGWNDDLDTTANPWKNPSMFVAIAPKSYAMAQAFELTPAAYAGYLADPNMRWFAKVNGEKSWDEFYAECKEVPDGVQFDPERGCEVFVEVLKIRMKGITMDGRNAKLLTWKQMLGMASGMLMGTEQLESTGNPQNPLEVHYRTIAAEGFDALKHLQLHYQRWNWNRPATEFTVQDTRKEVHTNFKFLKGMLGRDGVLYPPGANRFECWRSKLVSQDMDTEMAI